MDVAIRVDEPKETDMQSQEWRLQAKSSKIFKTVCIGYNVFHIFFCKYTSEFFFC